MSIKILGMRIEDGCLIDMEVTGCDFHRGKVREIIDLGDALLFVMSDRISAFDVVLPTGIPEKGRALTRLSEFWFDKTRHIIPNCMISTDVAEICRRLGGTEFRQVLIGRSMLMRKCRPLPVEAVVRGFLYGSADKLYKAGQRTICGVTLPDGLVEASRLEAPILTPTTKAETGHDENITFDQMVGILTRFVGGNEDLGADLAVQVHDRAIALYNFGRDYAAERGVIIADTKFEFGLDKGQLVLIDEVLTPDSSRFWPKDQYKPGGSQPSFDKQFVRDYLEGLCQAGKWKKTPENIPVLPPDVVATTTRKYCEAVKLITGVQLLP